MDWKAEHLRIVRDAPPMSELPAGCYVVAVRRPENVPTDAPHIFWRRVKSDAQLSRLIKRYSKTHFSELDIQVAFEGNIQSPATFISELDIYGDRIVLLEACVTDPALFALSGAAPMDTDIADESKLDPVQAVLESETTEPVDTWVRHLIEQDDPEILEASVREGIKVLEQLCHVFSQAVATIPEAQVWVDSITDLLSTPKQKRQYLGVVGNTGAGKSSIINALLDEERLVPTNCMRACTAVVTEISWNESTDPAYKYRAEIEFLTSEEWRVELALLLDETSNDGPAPNDLSNPGTAIGVAWAKLQALFPELAKATLPSRTLDDLMKREPVAQLLGTTISVANSNARDFYQQVQQYVDSKEKTSAKSKRERKGSGSGFWPLIKVVRIYVRSPVLSTGAVIVDLPGIQDDNAARAAVADSYTKKCNGMLIVAPITRAVDDKAAKDLLGDTFKRQLKFDCAFSGITFVCSKTDDIEIREATESLGIQDQVLNLQNEISTCKDYRKDLKTRLITLKERLEEFNACSDELYEKQDQWQLLKEKAESREPVYAPQESSSKRRKGNTRGNAHKRQRLDSLHHSDHSEEEISDSEIDEDVVDDDMKQPPNPLTEDNVQEALEDIKSQWRELREVRANTNTEIKQLREELRDSEIKAAAYGSQITALCIVGRNDYSREAIQHDFAAGVKEIDEESAIRTNEQQFDPEDAIRDYDEIANALPVFCVSSRAYQKLQGRLEDDGAISGFTSLLQTEIPQLQEHCQELTKHKRVQSARTFLQDLCSELLSCHTWSKDTKTVVTSNKRRDGDLETMLCQLESAWEPIAEEFNVTLTELVSGTIVNQCRALTDNAINDALEISRNWAQGRSENGLPHSTYKAVARRHGVFHSCSSGLHDFNADLMKPIMKQLGTTWEHVFQSQVPKALDAYVKRFQAELCSFYSAVNDDPSHKTGVNFNDIALERQAQRAEQFFNGLKVDLLEEIMEDQRGASREFIPVIKSKMYDAYTVCSTERGQGCFARMKSAMDSHVDEVRHTMFHSAIDNVSGRLDDLCTHAQSVVRKKVNKIIAQLRANQSARSASIVRMPPRVVQENQDFKADIESILRVNNACFKAIFDGLVHAEARGLAPKRNEHRNSPGVEEDGMEL